MIFDPYIFAAVFFYGLFRDESQVLYYSSSLAKKQIVVVPNFDATYVSSREERQLKFFAIHIDGFVAVVAGVVFCSVHAD